MNNLLFNIIKRIILRKRTLQNGKVDVTGFVRGIQQVDFEGNNAVLNDCNFNGNIKVGYATTFGIHNLIHGDIEIGKYCQFAPYAAVNTYNHPTKHISTYINNRLLDGILTQYKTSQKTLIGNDVWIGKNAIILGGVTIGNGAIIAAGSVVTKDVPDYHIASGIPATNLKQRFPDTIINELLDLEWWNKSEDELKKIKPLFEKDLSNLNSIYE